ncbi:ribosomal protein S7 domain-containing protein [Polychytrium aggregatum]|uniref:ribosomal protein S7 domain-containing protein n=1 Tax=Polychytrium aggregatum TaxID=110093 RepID=UPI0022FF1585|nr:ribosomal protein S7 domain-containing protein [Polychytrium aggregatum]KAI9206722.1 ribosomal protein S7 domain-containing protein [Polychytrium aggregatum]
MFLTKSPLFSRIACGSLHPSARLMSTKPIQQQVAAKAPAAPSSGLTPTTSPAPAETASPFHQFTTEDPVIAQLVNTIMRDGKKNLARRIITGALEFIQKETKQNPRDVLNDAIDKASPLLKLKSQRRGAKAVISPRPLTVKQMKRQAMIWIIQAAEKRKDAKTFAEKLGKEMLDVTKDQGSAVDKRNQVHKTALQNRSNVLMMDQRLRR